MEDYKRLNDVYTNWLTSGIFTDLQSFNVPWKDKNINHELDIAYHGNRSGYKIVSVIIDRFLNSDGTISSENRTKIAESLYTVYGQNWTKLWNTTIQDYNLLDNTDAYTTESTTTEQNTDTTNHGTDSGTVTHAITGSDTVTNTGTVTTGGSSTENTTNNNSIYGFNSTDASNADSQSVNGETNINQTETRNTQDKTDHNTTDTETRNLSNALTGNEKTTGTITHEIHRHGNIGVTTSQQMLEQERNLWKWYFYNYIFSDIDKFITIAVY